MKVFLEGEQNQMHQRVGVLKPGLNEVPDDVGKALVDGCVNYCGMVREADPNAQPVQVFRLATEADEAKPGQAVKRPARSKEPADEAEPDKTK